MSFEKVSPGKDVPNEVNVVIEIPAQEGQVKYEVDKDTDALFVDRFMQGAMRYPCNYGYVPQTLSEDGDPVDVLVVTPYPMIAGCVVRARPVGMLRMTDESGPDAKILAVPVDKLYKPAALIETLDDFGETLLRTIEHFFSHYKDLEPNKWVKIDGWEGIDSAKQEILASIDRYEG